jgi:hypothetical protein
MAYVPSLQMFKAKVSHQELVSQHYSILGQCTMGPIFLGDYAPIILGLPYILSTISLSIILQMPI